MPTKKKELFCSLPRGKLEQNLRSLGFTLVLNLKPNSEMDEEEEEGGADRQGQSHSRGSPSH